MIWRPNTLRNIALCGYHAAGKSYIGQELARRLNRQFVDLPEEVARRQGGGLLGIRRLKQSADPVKLEERLVGELAYRRTRIIALGAETLSNPVCLSEIKAHCFLVFLDVPFSKLWERISQLPRYRETLLATGREQACQHWQALLPGYQEAELQLTNLPDGVYHPTQHVLHCYYT